MSRLLVYIMSISVAFSIAFSADEWHFENISEQYPAINSIFNIREPWVSTTVNFYKGYTVLPRPLHGFSLYKNQEWTFYTPDIIKANLINKDAADAIDMTQISMHTSLADSDDNLWLAADNAIYRLNSQGIYCYYTLKSKEGKYKTEKRVFDLIQNEESIYCLVGHTDFTDSGVVSKIKFYRYEPLANEFVEFSDDKLNLDRKYPQKSILDSKGVQFSMSSLLDTLKISTAYNMHFGLLAKDTLVLSKSDLVLYKLKDNKYIESDSSIFALELERKIKKGISPASIVKSNFSFIDLEYNFYVMNIYKRENANGKWIQEMPRIYKYAANGLANYVEVPKFPGDTLYHEPDDFAVDADGNITLVYYDKGIFNYSASSAVEQTEQLLPGAWIWKLYPNPATERARIEFHLSREARSNAQITISDIRGTAIKDISSEIEYDDARQEAIIDFSVADIPSGNYYILISAGNSKKLKRFIVNR